MVAELSAAIKFSYEELLENVTTLSSIKNARVIYVTGFSLSTSFNTVDFLADSLENKVIDFSLKKIRFLL